MVHSWDFYKKFSINYGTLCCHVSIVIYCYRQTERKGPWAFISDVRAEIEAIERAAREDYNLGQEDCLTKIIHDDIVFLPPGHSVIRGKEGDFR